MWAEKPEADVGLALIEFLSSHIEATNLTFTTFFEATRNISNGDRNALINVVNYLAGSDLNLLDVGLELIENEEIFPLDYEQAKAARNENVHPITGEFDPNLTSKLFFCFSPSATAKRALRG
ncbi:MAG: hypothetical protein J0H48_02955 [Nitrosospira multiformis]|nr:hypothetical protein [Nitrosospira multiformis]